MAKDPHKYFRVEARDLLSQFGAVVLDLEKGGNSGGQVQSLLRLAHTLKGAARVVKEPAIADAAHAIEEALAPYRDPGSSLPRASIDKVLVQLEEIDGRVKALQPDGADRAAGSAAKIDDVRVVRADVVEMDTLLEGLTETQTLLNGLRAAPGALEQTQRLATLLVEQLAPRAVGEKARQPWVAREQALATAEELRRGLVAIKGQLGSAVEQIGRELHQSREAAEQLRLVATQSLFVVVERTVLDTAKALGKNARFEGSGGEIRLDAHVLGVIQNAVVQIVRNAVAHGIEPVLERKAAGKSETGCVTLDVVRRGRHVAFLCSDDGGGVDLAAVRAAASRRGLLDKESHARGPEELIRLLMHGGISTSDKVTEVSGRGIGLDIVRDAVASLGGEAIVHTERGKGTTFELVVPLAVASLDALAAEAAGNIVTIPLDAVERAARFAGNEIAWSPSGASVLLDRKAIPFVALPQILFGERRALVRTWPALIVATGGERIAVGVDRVVGTARVVVRPLPDLAPAESAIAGTTFDAEGNPQLVLDPAGLAALAQRRGRSDPAPSPRRKTILVVDDSLTTRMLEQSILESAGYKVDLATTGEEGLERLRSERPALILCDVEMPGIDGFTFVERLRADPALHDLPVILVTSRSNPDDVQRGKDVRAQGYVIKSEFDQARLIAMIRSLTG